VQIKTDDDGFGDFGDFDEGPSDTNKVMNTLGDNEHDDDDFGDFADFDGVPRSSSEVPVTTSAPKVPNLLLGLANL